MPIDTWFPLAIYYKDLEESQQRKSELLHAIETMQATSSGSGDDALYSWTGDINNVDRIHLDDRFEWIISQVEKNALEYLRELGHDLRKIDLYIQRAWPVIGRKGQRVARHAHHTAHLSAVYYVSVPAGDKPGVLRFFNDHRQSELAPGLGTGNTKGYADYNIFNYSSADYTPAEGRLVVFPSKQTHDVEPNQSDEVRISLAFDLVITSRGGAEDGYHEFLMPSPTVWRRLHRAASSTTAGISSQPVPGNRLALAEVASLAREIDAFTIPEQKGHVLWETTVLRHCFSQASWDLCRAFLDETSADDWTLDYSGTIGLFAGCQDQDAFRDAVNRVYLHLRSLGIPLDGASLTAPLLQRREEVTTGIYRRGRAHLCVYLRLDYGQAGTPCRIEFASGEDGREDNGGDDSGPIVLAPGEMALVSGFRRHRLTGSSHVLQFQLDLPAIARPGIVDLRGFQLDTVDDATVFSVVTAAPFTRPLPPVALLGDKLAWNQGVQRRRNRHQDCPAVQRFLIARADPATATTEEVNLIRAHGGRSAYGSGVNPGLPDRLVEQIPVLSATRCHALRTHTDRHMTSLVPDSVDDLPEYQVNFSIQTLGELIGEESMARLLRLPEHLGAPADRPVDALYQSIEIFTRVYGPDTRPWITFHADNCHYTAIIALNDLTDYQGGRLVALDGDRLRATDWAEGSAVLHTGGLVHGVSQIEHGNRYSLILFFTLRPEMKSSPVSLEVAPFARPDRQPG